MRKDKDKIERGEVSRRDFLIGAGSVVVGGAIGAGITYPLVSGKDGEVTTKTVEVTKTVEKPTTVTTTVAADTVTTTKTVGAGETVTTTVGGGTKTVTTTVGDGAGVEPAFEPEETSIMIAGPSCGESVAVDVKHNKIIRTRPLRWDSQYTESELAATQWSFSGKHRVTGETVTYTPRKKSIPNYLAIPYKKRVYSPNRILYPLKRVDWEPGGDPAKINPQNRGKSKFKRISWEDALDIAAGEIKRVQDKYGVYGVLDKQDSTHRESKTMTASCSRELMQLTGGYTMSIRNPDSWEGWYYGSAFVWGMCNKGFQRPQYLQNVDVAENTEMLIMQGCDWDTTMAIWGGFPSRMARYFRDLGIKLVYIAPDMNYENTSNPDKWIPVIPGSDAAMHCAIVHTWLKEDTWDKDYVATHAVGLEYIEDYIMGRSDDMVEKTPEWASARCGVPPWTIKALAREWAKKKTSTQHGCGGSYIRGPYGWESARWEAVCLGMQGLGAPGCNQTGDYFPAQKADSKPRFSTGPVTMRSRVPIGVYPVPEKQSISKPMVSMCILDGHAEWYSTTTFTTPLLNQFDKQVYPIPEEEGGTHFHMIFQDHACMTGCWPNASNYLHALRTTDPETMIEAVIILHIWMENDCLNADLILPACTNYECSDFETGGAEFSTLQTRKAPVSPVGESMTDYDICAAIAKKLDSYGGRYAGILNKLTGGKTQEEWIAEGFPQSGAQDYVSFEEFKEKGYVLSPTDPNWQDKPHGHIQFYEDPMMNPLMTPTGKLEFYSAFMAEKSPDDTERKPYPRYVVGGPGQTWDESQVIEDGAEKCKTYPLVLQSQHCRWREHVQLDDVPWLREIPSCKIKGYDGYMYEAVWLHPVDAAARGIKHGDIIKLYNERGTELCGAYVTERIKPGSIHADHGAHVDYISNDEEDWDDRGEKWVNRGGTLNQLSPDAYGHKYIPQYMVVSAYLVEAAKVTGDEMQQWREEHPNAFARDYDPAYGLLFDAWLEKEEV